MLYGCTLYEQKIAISIFISDFDIVSDGAFSCRDLCVCVCVSNRRYMVWMFVRHIASNKRQAIFELIPVECEHEHRQKHTH